MNDSTPCAAVLRSAPWHRQRWPWLLMLGPGIVVLAGFATLWIALRSDDGLVADDYYKRGLAVNQTLDRSVRGADLGLSATLDVTREGDVTLRLRSHDAAVPAAMPPVVRLRLVHPTRAGPRPGRGRRAGTRRRLSRPRRGAGAGAPARHRRDARMAFGSDRGGRRGEHSHDPRWCGPAMTDPASGNGQERERASMRAVELLWPSFLVAALAEFVAFAFIDPAALQLTTGEPVSRLAGYTITFFAFWSIGALSAWLARLVAAQAAAAGAPGEQS
jgi:hypothetical protein